MNRPRNRTAAAFWSIGSGWGIGGQAIGLGLLAWAFLAWNGHGPGARREGESTHEWSTRLGDGIRADRSTPPQDPAGPSAGNRAAAASGFHDSSLCCGWTCAPALTAAFSFLRERGSSDR